MPIVNGHISAFISFNICHKYIQGVFFSYNPPTCKSHGLFARRILGVQGKVKRQYEIFTQLSLILENPYQMYYEVFLETLKFMCSF